MKHTHTMLVDCACLPDIREPRIICNLEVNDLNLLLFNDRVIRYDYYRNCYGKLKIIKIVHCNICRKKEKIIKNNNCILQ